MQYTFDEHVILRRTGRAPYGCGNFFLRPARHACAGMALVLNVVGKTYTDLKPNISRVYEPKRVNTRRRSDSDVRNGYFGLCRRPAMVRVVKDESFCSK